MLLHGTGRSMDIWWDRLYDWNIKLIAFTCFMKMIRKREKKAWIKDESLLFIKRHLTFHNAFISLSYYQVTSVHEP